MSKEFRYPYRRTLFNIVIPTVLAALVVLYVAVTVITKESSETSLSIGGLALLIFLDHFIALSHPDKVVMSDSSIEFIGFNRSHRYSFEQIRRINLRKTAFTKSAYLRINDAGLLKGRYWLQFDNLSDGDELLARLNALIEVKHPMMKNFDRRSFTRTK